LQVLVVGGAGYIGSVTVVELLAAGHEVIVLDNLSSGHRRAVHPQAELVVGDMGDGELLQRLLSSRPIEAVVYLGGLIVAPESLQRPDLYFQSNVASVITLLNAMVAHGVRRFVFSSSAAVYGEAKAVPIGEEAPLQPVNPYGEAKAAIERLLPWYEAAFGLKFVSLRYFNAAGATGSLGEDHRPETHLIPRLLRAALGQGEAITLYGTDYPTPDGTCIRDYIHVADLARAHALALERCREGSAVYNLGIGRGYSNREVIEAARRVTGRPIPVREGPRRPGDPAVLVAGAEKAKRELGWQPCFTDLEAIIDSAWDWHRRHPQGYED